MLVIAAQRGGQRNVKVGESEWTRSTIWWSTPFLNIFSAPTGSKPCYPRGSTAVKKFKSAAAKA
ncbi:hypothetical protein ATE59_10545 [Sphingopyxis sp. A083]|nr:hypothetical protein ATE59_10545 [Sphingopyxis sp. A083]